MERSALRTFAEIEQHMKAARQLRAETAAGGCRWIFGAFRRFVRGVADRVRSPGRVALPN